MTGESHCFASLARTGESPLLRFTRKDGKIVIASGAKQSSNAGNEKM
jgi:hypothetical protein